MVSWKTCQLGEIVNLKRGYDLPHGSRSSGPFPVVSSSGITDYHSEAMVKAPGVVTGRYGTLGQVFFIESDFWPLNTSLYVQDFKGNDPRYVAYLLGSLNLGSQNAAGAVPGVNRNHLHMMEIVVPSLSTQQRIAGILSAYDNLIENSQRRIKILESMARALYREWFVAFRFPGHEAHPRVPSPLGEIPKGWNVQRLDELSMSIQDGDWVETKDQGGEDFRLLQISNIGLGEFIETGNFRYVTQETFSRLRCSEIEPNDLLIARMPTPIGRGWLATNMPWRMITAVDVAIIRAEPSVVLPIFLAQAWNEPANLARIAAQASGTTRLRITRRELAAMEFIVPPISLQGQFAAFAGPIAEMVQRLRQQSQNLRITRDLLLPRLLSEQLDVSAGLPEEEPILAVERAAPAPKPASAPRPVPPRAAAPPPPPAREAPAPGRADLEPEALLAAIRQLFGDGAARDRDTALRDLAQSLGHQRLGKRIKENLASALLTAVRRGILTNSQGAYTLGFRTVEDCTRDSLKADFVSSLGRSWATRTEAIQGFARYLGFSRTGPVLDDTARSLINGLIREGRLETDDPDRIRRT